MRLLLLLAALAAVILVSDAALAAMSIDLGSQFIKIGLVKIGVPMEIVLNKESRRKTPNLLSIRNNERLFADSAAALALKYPKNSYPYLLQLLAKKDDDPAIALYKDEFPYAEFSKNDKRGTVQFTADGEVYDIETLLAMILWSAKKTTEAFAEQSVKDVVITIPAFFNQAERRAVTVAAEIAGLNLLQLLSDASAAALNYGVFRRKEITEQAQTMLIYDMGAVKTTATIVEYQLVEEKDKKEKNPVVRTIGIGYDRTLGGLPMTLRLQKHLEEIFRKTKKTPTDIATNARSMAKLLKEAERVKQVLSANTKTFAQIENVHEDTDFRAEVNREEFEKLIADMESRFAKPILDALRMAELNIEQVDQVVLMGAGTRVPRVKAVIQEVLKGKELGNFLNTDEAIALGAVYQSAHLSKGFKVLPFGVQELQLFPVELNFLSKDEAGAVKPVTKGIFNYKTHYPAPKKIVTFTSYDDDFDFTLNYGSLAHLNDQQLKEFGSHNLSQIYVSKVKDELTKAVEPEGSIFKGFKVHIGIDLSGVVSVQKVELHAEQPPPPPTLEELAKEEEEERKRQEEEAAKEAEEKKTEEEKKEEGSDDEKKEGETDKKEGDEKTDEETNKKNDKKKKEKKEVKKEKEEPKPKKIKVKMDIRSEERDFLTLDKDEIIAAKEKLSKFEKAEKEKHDKEEAMNALEGAVYDLGGKVEHKEGVVEYLTEEEITKLTEELAKLRVWMEDEAGIDTPTKEYIDKKRELDDITEKGRFRMNEQRNFPKTIEAVTQLFNHSSTFLRSARNLTKKEGSEDGIFTEKEIEVLEKLHDDTFKWFNEKNAEREKQAKSDDPVLTIEETEKKAIELEREVKYLLNKLMSYKPKPKKEDKKKNETEKPVDPSNMEKSDDDPFADAEKILQEEDDKRAEAEEAKKEEKAKRKPIHDEEAL